MQAPLGLQRHHSGATSYTYKAEEAVATLQFEEAL